ncbi:MAG: LptA/OstA family protein [Rhizobiaceae bacterium]|nr:LptA/OstA family protein [Rhizobiaceae bacterium]
MTGISFNWRLACAACLFAITAPLAAFAQNGSASQLSGLKLSGDKPIQIESDRLEVNESESMAVFSGNVNVVQGATVLKAGKMTVYYVKDGSTNVATGGASNIDHLEVEGKVYVKADTQVATGDRGTFDMKTEVLVLSGKEVVLSDGPNVLVGCKLTVQMKTGQANVEGCGSSQSTGRVRVLMQPSSQKQSQSQ